MWNPFKKKALPLEKLPRINGDQIYDYRILEASDLGDYANAIDDIYHRRYDGILVKNALSEATCDAIIAKMEMTPESEGSAMPVAWAFPVIFAALIRGAYQKDEAEGDAAMKAYFDKCEKITANSEAYFGAPVTELIEEWLGKFSGGLPLEIPKGYDGEGRYANTTYRSYLPHGVGNISVHCGNWFQTIWEKFYSHLAENVAIFDQLSYFFVLHEPESGGELTLYDIEWETGQDKRSNHENETVTKPDGSPMHLKDRKCTYVRPRKGDMILFAGGQIWHRVESVNGPDPRITLGGFLSFGKDRDKIVYWT